MGKKLCLSLVLIGMWIKVGFSQDSSQYHTRVNYNKLFIAGTIITAGEYYFLDYIYHNNDLVPFYFINDLKGFLQMDKFHHMYGSYLESTFGYNFLMSSGLKKNNALFLGGSLGFLLQTPKELLDGHFSGHGFSWGDIAANATGSAIFISQELLFNEQIAKLKFSFSKSEHVDISNGYLGKDIWSRYMRDYNGHTYWLSLNANKVFLRSRLPGWISIAAGYSCNGILGAYENIDQYNGIRIPDIQRYRQFIFSLDIDWSEVPVKSKFLKQLFKSLNYFKIPFPSIEVNSKGQFKGYWLYF